jgi:hypothetical protein
LGLVGTCLTVAAWWRKRRRAAEEAGEEELDAVELMSQAV